MKFGTFHLVECPEHLSWQEAYEQELEQMLWAEELGFDNVWITEHHFNRYGICADALLMAAHVAAKTSRIRIGTSVVIPPFHNPIRLAEQVAMVDSLSGGRLDLGIGRGYQPEEYRMFNISMDESRERLHENIEILVKALTEPRFSYEGKYNYIEDETVLPRPVQQPKPQMFAASATPETAVLMVKHDMVPLFGGGLIQGTDDIRGRIGVWRDLAEAGGYTPEKIDLIASQIPVLTRVHVGDSTDEVWQKVRGPLQWFLERFVPLGLQSQLKSPEFEQYKKNVDQAYSQPIDAFKDLDVYGDPDRVISKIEQLESAGVGHVICWMTFGGLDHTFVKNSMKRLAEEVMPHFRAKEMAAVK